MTELDDDDLFKELDRFSTYPKAHSTLAIKKFTPLHSNFGKSEIKN